MFRIRNDIIAVLVFLLMIASLSTMTIISYRAQESLISGDVSGTISLKVGETGVTPTEEPGPGGPGGGGGGGGPATTASRSDFTVTPDFTKVNLIPGQTSRASLAITNTGETLLSFGLKVNILDAYVTVDEDSFSLSPGESKTIYLDFKIPLEIPLDVYSGELIISTKEITKKIPIVIDVESKDTLLDLKVTIPEEFKKVKAGETVYARISLFNLIDEPINIELYYAIKDTNNNIVNSGTERIVLNDTLVLSKGLAINGATGDYIFYSKVTYKGKTAVDSDVFELVSEIVSPRLRISGVYIYAGLFLVLIILLLITYQHRKLKNLEKGQSRKLSTMYSRYKKEKKTIENKNSMKDKLEKQKTLLEKAYKGGHIGRSAYIKGRSKINNILGKIK